MPAGVLLSLCLLTPTVAVESDGRSERFRATISWPNPSATGNYPGTCMATPVPPICCAFPASDGWCARGWLAPFRTWAGWRTVGSWPHRPAVARTLPQCLRCVRKYRPLQIKVRWNRDLCSYWMISLFLPRWDCALHGRMWRPFWFGA